MATLVLSAVVRISTHRRIFKNPSPVEEAFGFCEDLMSQPHCDMIEPGERQIPVFQPSVVDGATGVKMARVEPDPTDFKSTYEPGNPAADKQGYVKEPNVDPLVEALDMKEAQRAYEASMNVIETSRAMDARTLDLLKK